MTLYEHTDQDFTHIVAKTNQLRFTRFWGKFWTYNLCLCKNIDIMQLWLFGRLSLTLMRANAMMLSMRHQDADYPLPEVDGVKQPLTDYNLQHYCSNKGWPGPGKSVGRCLEFGVWQIGLRSPATASINRRSAWQSCDLVAVSINRRSAAGDQRVTATQRGLVRNLSGVAVLVQQTCTSTSPLSLLGFTHVLPCF